MATQGDYTAVANALMHLIYTSIGQLPPWEQNYIPKEKIPAAAGKAAQVAVDALDAYRASQPIATSVPLKRKYRRKK